MTDNIFRLPEQISKQKETTEQIYERPQLSIEKIVSVGHRSPDGFWYDQPEEEWVLLLQGTAMLRFEDGKIVKLNPGDYLSIPAHRKHRVEQTSEDPLCIWLCVFVKDDGWQRRFQNNQKEVSKHGTGNDCNRGGASRGASKDLNSGSGG